MTTDQRKSLMAKLWPAACRAQGWKASDRGLRLRVLGEALGHPISTANAIQTEPEFDTVKAHLLKLAYNLQGAMESGHPEIGRARRLRTKIIELVRCLNLYTDGEAYAREIIRDGTHRAGCDVTAFDQVPLDRLLEELEAKPRWRKKGDKWIERPSQLDQMLMTLSGRLNGKDGFRKQAGHTVHDMLIRAGLPCDCKACWNAAMAAQFQQQAEEEVRFEDLDPQMDADERRSAEVPF